jgi:cellulose synthase/poly-beta-1,6-N-acetylglucosamine synthase-like glycosyltransferase
VLFLYDVFRFGFFFVFVGMHCALMIGLMAEWYRDRQTRTRKAAPDSPKVSVIVPIHNEAERLTNLLRSLSGQDYSAREYIFIDDRSEDASLGILEAFLPGLPESRIISIRENPGPNHKQYALAKGIQAAQGAFLLFTDGDCEVPAGWISAMVKRMADPRTGAVLGPVFKRSGGSGFFHLYQCFDHAVRYMYLAGSTGLGAAGGGFGNNLILRREALDAIGGYDSVPASPTEDAALISRIRSCSKYRIRSGLGADLFVLTAGEKTWKALLNQTLRWNNGGLFSPDRATRFNFAFLMITIAMGILALPLLPLVPSLWTLSAAVMLSMALNTFAVLGLFGSTLPKKGIAYIFQLIFTPCYFTFLTILGFCGIKFQWKGSFIQKG